MTFYTFEALSQFCALFCFHDDFNPKAVTYSNRVLHSDTGRVYIYLNKCIAVRSHLFEWMYLINYLN